MKHILIVMICCYFISGCKGNQGEQGPTGPRLTGTLLGSVVVLDSAGHSIKNPSGVHIVFSPNGDSTISLSDGSWQLENMPAGIYDITYEKTGFYTVKQFQFQFVGGGTYKFYSVSMIQFLSGSVTQFSASDTGKFIRFQGTLNGNSTSTNRNVYLFISKSPFSNTEPIIGDYVAYVLVAGGSQFSYDLEGDYLGNIATTGDTLFAVAVLGGSGNPGVNFLPTGQVEFDTKGVPLSKTATFIVPSFY